MLCLWNELSSVLSIFVPISSLTQEWSIPWVISPHTQGEGSLFQWIGFWAWSTPSPSTPGETCATRWDKPFPWRSLRRQKSVVKAPAPYRREPSLHLVGSRSQNHHQALAVVSLCLCDCCRERTKRAARESGLWIWVAIFSEPFTCCFVLFDLWSSVLGSSGTWSEREA